MPIIAALIFALFISLIFAPGYRRGSFGPLIIIFLVLFMAGIASQYWIIPFGPTWQGVSFTPLLFIVFVFSFLLLAPSPYERRSLRNVNNTDAAAPAAVVAVSVFVWILLVMLAIAVLVGLFRGPITNSENKNDKIINETAVND